MIQYTELRLYKSFVYRRSQSLLSTLVTVSASLIIEFLTLPTFAILLPQICLLYYADPWSSVFTSFTFPLILNV